MNNISVVYTPFTNLKKTAGMEVGQVGFHSQKKVCHCILLWLYPGGFPNSPVLASYVSYVLYVAGVAFPK